MNCRKCGGFIMLPGVTYAYGGPICNCNQFSNNTQLKIDCEHCFCQTEVVSDGNVQVLHDKCCMCGTRRLKKNNT